MNDAPANAVGELVSGRHGKGAQMVNADSKITAREHMPVIPQFTTEHTVQHTLHMLFKGDKNMDDGRTNASHDTLYV